MTELSERIEAVVRDLIIEHEFEPLEKVIPAAGAAAGLFNACVARLDADRCELHAFLAWHGQDAAELRGRSAALRDALRAADSPGMSRVCANLFVVSDSMVELAAVEEALKGVEEGHFLEKILVAPVAVALRSGQVKRRGRAACRPTLDWFEQHFLSSSGHAAAEVLDKLKARELEHARSRRLLGKGDTWATWGLIAINAAVFAVELAVAGHFASRYGNGQDQDRSVELALQVMGANQHHFVFGLGEAWRLLACIFLHFPEYFGIHLIVNMASLFSLGTLLERLCGMRKFLLIYLASGLMGSLLSALRPEGGMSVGASGAIMGLAGALLALKWRRPAEFPLALAERIFSALAVPVAATFALGIALEFWAGPVRLDNWAHFGGLFAGFSLAYFWPSLLQKPLRKSA